MKKKGYCFRRTVSLLLAAAMILTAAPQTSLTALAAGQEMDANDPDASAILDAEDGASTETDEPAASVSENAGEQDGADTDGDNDNDDNDEADLPVDSNLAVDIQSVPENDSGDGESGTGNDPGEELGYKGNISEDPNGDNPFTKLDIDEQEASKEKGIKGVLEYYAGEGKKFNCVGFNISVEGESSKAVLLKKEYINGALAILADELVADRDRRWIEFSFQRRQGEDTTVTTTYSLWRPQQCSSDINVTLAQNIPYQGVLIHTDVPRSEGIENISLMYNLETGAGNDLSNCFGDTKEAGVLKWENDAPAGWIKPNGMQFENSSENGINVSFSMSLNDMQENQDYMITPLYRENEPVEGTKELQAGTRSGSADGITDVAWKSLNDDLISIAPGEGANATLTAKNTGEAYYCVTYTSGENRYLELHAVNAAGAGEEDKEPAYKGEVREEEMYWGDYAGTKYQSLSINGKDAQAANVEITAILEYYKKQIEAGKQARFCRVAIDTDSTDENSFSFTIKKDVLDAALAIMDTENTTIGYWIDYGAWNKEVDELLGYTLNRPHTADKDYTVQFDVTLMPNQGVKLNAKTKDFPSDYVTMSYNKLHPTNESAFKECWSGASQKALRMLTLENGVPTGLEDWGEYEKYEFWVGDVYKDEAADADKLGWGSNFGIRIDHMEAGKDYLITPWYSDGSLAKNKTKEIQAGARSGSSAEMTNVSWKSLNEDLITVGKGEGANATLTAKDGEGEAYYYATYTQGGKSWLELHSVQVISIESDLNYVGEILNEVTEDENHYSYTRLCLDEKEAQEQNGNSDLTPILEAYKKSGVKVNCIELMVEADQEPKNITLKEAYINAALPVLDQEAREPGYWIDYNFWYPGTTGTGSGTFLTLSSPREASSDVNVRFTLSELANQGLKVRFTNTNLPAERVSMRHQQGGELYTSLNLSGENPFRLFTHSSDTPKAIVDADDGRGWGHYSWILGQGTSVYFNNIKPLGTTEYLAAYIYEDASHPVVGGEPVQLEAGTRAGTSTGLASISWKPFDTSKATIDKDGKLTAWSEGEIYYYVRYKVGSKQYLEVHEMYAIRQPVTIAFAESDITMEMNPYSESDEDQARKYLRLRFSPSDAERDTHDPSQIKWEITEGGGGEKPVIDFAYYDNDWNEVEKDEDGKLPDGAAPNGEIIALNPGEATVRVTYLDVEKGTEPPTATCTVKVVKPLMWEDIAQEERDKVQNLYAVMDLDKKLSDVALPTGWKWKNPETELANFKGADHGQFAADYTADGRTIDCHLWVRFVNVTGINITSKNLNPDKQADEPDWFDGAPDSIEKGNQVILGYSYNMENLDGSTEETWQREYDKVKEKFEKNYRIDWTSNPAGAGTVKGETYEFTGPQISKATKYTFTVSVKDKMKNRVFLKNSRAITVTVNDQFDWDLVEEPWTETEGEQMYLYYKVRMQQADYESQKLTIASEDAAILKLNTNKTVLEEKTEGEGENQVKYTYVKIPCSNPKPGTAWIKLTAKDEIKSVRRDHLEFVDKEPKLTVSAVTINQALTDRSAEVTVRTHSQYPLDTTSNVTLLLNGQSSDSITAEVVTPPANGPESQQDGGQGDSYNDYAIKLFLKQNAADVGKKNKVTLKLAVKPANAAGQGANAASEEYSLDLTVNVTKTVPKVTFKQAKKVNLFYNDVEGYGVLNVTGTEIQNLELKDCDFTVDLDARSGVYRIAPKAGADGTDKRGTLSYQIDGYTGTFTANLNVAAETKKPTIVLSQKSDTLYPVQGYRTSWLWMTDKATGEPIVPSEVTYVIDKNKGERQPLSIERYDIDWEHHAGEWNIKGKTDYNLIATRPGGIAFLLQDKAEYRTKTDKFNLEIREANWKDSIAISYSIKADAASPKLVLGKSTLTLNKNDAVYSTQQDRTSLHLKGTADPVYQDEYSWVEFEGQDEKSRRILKGDSSLVLQYRNERGDIVANFNKNSMDAGTYKFKVNVGNRDAGLIASTALKVKIVDVSMAKTLKVTAKGSIDIMNREGTSIAYTPKISNLSGKVVGGHLVGLDSNLFDSRWEDGKLIVQARPDVTYSTKHKYVMFAEFEVDTEEYERLTVKMDQTKNPLSFKVKQGKPKLTASTAGNTIYRQLDNEVQFKLSAVLNKREVEIEDVQLLNYTDDFELRQTLVTWTDEGGQQHSDYAIYDSETKSVRLGLRDRYHTEKITKSGKTWKVKLAVRYRDQAGNEKNAQVTCSVVVR